MKTKNMLLGLFFCMMFLYFITDGHDRMIIGFVGFLCVIGCVYIRMKDGE